MPKIVVEIVMSKILLGARRLLTVFVDRLH